LRNPKDCHGCHATAACSLWPDLEAMTTAPCPAAIKRPAHARALSVEREVQSRPARRDFSARLSCYNLQTNWKKIMSDKDEQDELERLRRENAALKKGASPGGRMKVSEKGALSIYGMGRFPVTLYKEQWLKLLDMSDEIRAFIAANEAQLKAKD
jgi:hypothetical protein